MAAAGARGATGGGATERRGTGTGLASKELETGLMDAREMEEARADSELTGSGVHLACIVSVATGDSRPSKQRVTLTRD